MKIIMIGDTKKAEILKFYGEVYKSDFTLIEGDFAFKIMNIGGNTFHFQVWQLSLDPSFRVERRRYYYGALGAIIIFDVLRLESFHYFPSWIKEIWRYTGLENSIPIVIVGVNTHERKKGNEYITDEKIHNFSSEMNRKYQAHITYITVDERTGENIAQIWETLGKWYLNYLQRLES
jgi:GTPase SAR1 family protein